MFTPGEDQYMVQTADYQLKYAHTFTDGKLLFINQLDRVFDGIRVCSYECRVEIRIIYEFSKKLALLRHQASVACHVQSRKLSASCSSLYHKRFIYIYRKSDPPDRTS